MAQEPGSDAIAELSVEQATEIATGIADSSPDQIAQQLSTITSAPNSIMRDVLIQTTVLKIPQNRFEESPMLREAVADAYVLTQPEQRATNKNMLVDVLGTASGREFVFSGPPSLRKIAIEGILAGSASYLSAAAGDGWLDQKVLETYATPAFDVAAQKGSTTVSGDSVNNAVGSAMGHPPGVDVPADPEAFEALMQSAANGEANLYAGNEVVDTIAGGIAEATKDMGGDLAQPVSITSLPVQFSNEGTGPVSLQVFRVELEGESRLVDNQGRVYENFDDWKSSNVLPAGMVTYRDGMRSDGALVTEVTHAVVDTGWERLGQVADVAALAGGVAASGVILFASAGTATPLVAGAWGVALGSAAYSGSKAAMSLHDRHSHGQTLNLSDPEARAAWFDVVASAATVGGAGITKILSLIHI